MSHHRPTIAYVRRQTDRGRSKKEILRMLKRTICREIYRLLTRPRPVPVWDDLRPARQAKGLTLTAVAQHLGVWPATISTLERGLRRDDQLIANYRTWLTPHNPPVPPPAPHQPARRRGQDAAPHRTNELDRAEHRHTIRFGGTLYRA
jgi:hypothetical protein